MKKLTIVILIVLAISAIMCGVTAFATSKETEHDSFTETSNGLNGIVKKMEYENLDFVVDPKSEKTIELYDVVADKLNQLNYVETEKLQFVEDRKVYQDEKGNRYYLNSKNECTGFHLNGSDSTVLLDPDGKKGKDSASFICAEDAINIAMECCEKYLGEKSASFSFDQISEDETTFTVRLAHKLGDEGVITSCYATFCITYEGYVAWWNYANYYETLNFDESRLNGITVSFLEEKALEKLKELYDRDFVRAEVKNLVLFCDDGKCYIRFNATGYMNDLDIVEVGKLRDVKLMPIGETLTYDIP